MEIKTQTIWIEVEKEGTGESLEQELEGILEKKSDMIVMTKDELETFKIQIAGDAFDAARLYERRRLINGALNNPAPNKTEYIKLLIHEQTNPTP